MTSLNTGTNFSQWPWADAVDIIADSTEAGFTDWRLPTKNEWLEVAANGSATYFGNSSLARLDNARARGVSSPLGNRGST